MSFLFPAALWGLTLLSIPVIIHLFNLRRIQVIEFSTLQFINEIESEVKRKKSLKHLLILLSRLLALFFLIMAFAQPVFQETTSQNPENRTVIYLDNSYSMNAVSAGQSSFLRGINLVESFLANYPLEREIVLQTNDFSNNLNRWDYKNSIEEQLTEIDFSGSARSFDEVMSKLDQLGSFRLIYLSDFQKSTLGEITETDKEVLLVPLGVSDQGNVFIDSVYFKDPILLFDRPNSLLVSLKNTDPSAGTNMTLRILNENRLLSSYPINFNDSQFQEVELEIDFRSLVSRNLRMTIDDPGLAFDNEYFITINSFERPIVHYIFQEEENRFVTGVYGNSTLFELTSVQFSNINYQSLENTDLIILDGFQSIPSGVFEYLRNADILVIPPDEIDKDSYSSFFNEDIVVSSDSTLFNLDLAEIENPLFENIFTNINQVDDLPKSLLVLKSDFGTPILSTAFGESFLLNKKVQERNLYLFGSPLDTRFTSMPVHAIFLPIMYRIAQFAGQKPSPLAFHLDSRIINMDIRGFQNETPLNVIGDDMDFIPNQNMSGATLTLELPPTGINTGYFHVLSEEDTLRTFALNHSRVESSNEYYSQEELLQIIEDYPSFSVMNTNDVSPTTSLSGIAEGNTQYWKYALFLALLFLVVETLLVRFL